MTFFHYRDVRIFTSLMLNYYLTRSGEPLTSPEQIRLIELRLDLIDEMMHGVPWRLGYRHINADAEVETHYPKDRPPILWYVQLLLSQQG